MPAAPSLAEREKAPVSKQRSLLRVRFRWALKGLLVVIVLGLVGFVLLEWPNAELLEPRPSPLFLLGNGDFLAELESETHPGYGYWAVRELPERVLAATLAIEDQRFYQHPGVDPGAVARAIGQNLKAGRRISGASTLAMQVARLQQPAPRSWWNKARESVRALLLVGRHGRRAVLHQYLRLAPYGMQIHGIRYAARRYFNKPVEDLSWAQIAYLCALPQAPGRMNPYTDSGHQRAQQRAEHILSLLQESGQLEGSHLQRAKEELRNLIIPPRAVRPREFLHAILYLKEKYQKLLQEGQVPEPPLFQTYLDGSLQRRIQRLLSQTVQRERERGVGNAACIVLEAGSSRVLAWVGSTDYFDAQGAGAIDFARVLRSPGSTLKPFLFAGALERGVLTPDTVLEDLRRAPQGVGNADSLFLGPLLPRVALGNSRNVPALQVLRMLGLEESYRLLGTLQLHDFTQESGYYGQGLVLGAMPTSLESLVRAYGIWTAQGKLQALSWFSEQAPPQHQSVLSPETALHVLDMLSDPMARLPSFPRMGASEFPFPVAVKTGTSSGFRDAWTVACSERIVVGVWVGHPDRTALDGQGGYALAAPLTQKILSWVHQEESQGLADHDFPRPSGYESLAVCGLSGQRATAGCQPVYQEMFPRGQAPGQTCSAHIRVAVDERTGKPASLETPPTSLQIRTLVDLPARYVDWALATDLPMLPLSDFQQRQSQKRSSWLTRSHHVEPPSQELPTVRIISPRPGEKVVIDPEASSASSTFLLEASVEPPVDQVVWVVDGQALATVSAPYQFRWRLQEGLHLIEARLASIQAPVTRVELQVFSLGRSETR